MFERIFEEVMEEMGMTAWYDLLDSEDFEIVELRISTELGYDCWTSEEFVSWYRDMCADL